MSYCLYELTFPNGKKYFGITKDFACRMRQHKSGSKLDSVLPVHAAIRKYGWENIDKKVLVIGSIEYIASLEIKIIDAFNSRRKRGYNIALGGQLSPMIIPEIAEKSAMARKNVSQWREKVSAYWTTERRLAQSIKFKGRKPHANTIAANTGRIVSPESRKKSSDSNIALCQNPEEIRRRSERATGRKMTAEQNEKNAAAKRKSWKNPEYRAALVKVHTGVKQSIETCAKHSASMREQWKRPERIEACRAAMTGRRWINDGVVNRQLRANNEIPNGWSFGMIWTKAA